MPCRAIVSQVRRGLPGRVGGHGGAAYAGPPGIPGQRGEMAMIRRRAILVSGIGVWARGSRAFVPGARGFLLTGGMLPTGAVLAGLALLGASAPVGAQTLTWSVVPSPSPGFQENRLVGVSCVSVGACMAVGTFANTPGVTRTLTERW